MERAAQQDNNQWDKHAAEILSALPLHRLVRLWAVSIDIDVGLLHSVKICWTCILTEHTAYRGLVCTFFRDGRVLSVLELSAGKICNVIIHQFQNLLVDLVGQQSCCVEFVPNSDVSLTGWDRCNFIVLVIVFEDREFSKASGLSTLMSKHQRQVALNSCTGSLPCVLVSVLGFHPPSQHTINSPLTMYI